MILLHHRSDEAGKFRGLTSQDRLAEIDVAENAVKWIVVPPGVVITKSQQMLAVFGAFSLYLNFINIFQLLLNFTGQREE